MPAVHEMSVRGEDDREAQVCVLNAPCVLGHGAARRWRRRVKPAHLIELRDLVDGDRLDRKTARQLPESFGQPNDSTTGDRPRVFLGHSKLRGWKPACA